MKKFTPLLLTLPFVISLGAAEFWQTKPFTDWSEKDLQKIESNSPWSKQVTVTMGGGGGRGEGGGDGGGASKAGRSKGGGDSSGDSKGGGGGGMMLTVSWRTALPVREAFARQKYGAEVETSPDAKKLLTEEQKSYVILLSGLPGKGVRGGDDMKAALIKATSLTVKGKDPIVPADIQMGTMNQKAVVVFIFPKTAPLDLDDKEVEFTTKLGRLDVKEKFRLKDMIYKGKLEL